MAKQQDKRTKGSTRSSGEEKLSELRPLKWGYAHLAKETGAGGARPVFAIFYGEDLRWARPR